VIDNLCLLQPFCYSRSIVSLPDAWYAIKRQNKMTSCNSAVTTYNELGLVNHHLRLFTQSQLSSGMWEQKKVVAADLAANSRKRAEP
jgi:hypothetical protein